MLRNALLALMFVCSIGAGAARATVLDDMLIAMRDGQTDTVRELLGRGFDPNSVDQDGNTLLILAAQYRQREMVTLLLQWRAKTNLRNRFGDTPLRIAALHGEEAMVRDLVRAGAQVNMTGWTPLIYAAFNGHLGIVDFLLAQGADVNAISEAGATALMVAARNGHMGTVKRLLAAGAEANYLNDKHETAVDWALKGGHTDAAEAIVAAGGVRGADIQRFTLQPKP